MNKRGLLLLIAGLLVIGVAGPFLALTTDTARPEQQTPSLDLASSASTAFISHDFTDGVAQRVNAGVTPDMAQALGLLVTVANGGRQQFDTIFVKTALPATSTDVDALLMQGRAFDLAHIRWSDSRYSDAEHAVAARLAGETGAATPFIATSSASVAVAMAAPRALAVLAPQAATAYANAVRQLVTQHSGGLPSSSVSISGIVATPPAQATYSGDALAAPLWYSESCVAGDRQLATSMWQILNRSRASRFATSLSLSGKVIDDTPSVRAAVGSAAAAQVAQDPQQALALLNQAATIDQHTPSFSGDAWLAVGRIVVTTPWLGTCPAA